MNRAVQSLADAEEGQSLHTYLPYASFTSAVEEGFIMDYSAQSPLTCLAAFHNGSSCLSITQREAEREEDKRGDGFNLWEGIKPSVAWL